MLAGLSRKRMLAVGVVLVAVVTAVWLAPLAWAKISINTIDPTATLKANGRLITVTGPVATDTAQPVFMRVTVTQRSTGAMAEGYASFTGTVLPQQWTVQARTIGAKSFDSGPATVVALAQTKVQGLPDDAHQWLVNVTLVKRAD